MTSPPNRTEPPNSDGHQEIDRRGLAEGQEYRGAHQGEASVDSVAADRGGEGKASTLLRTSNSLFFEPTSVIRAMAGPAALHHLCLITLADPQ